MTPPKHKQSADGQRTLPQIRDWQAITAICAAVALFFRDILLANAYLWEDFLYYFYPVRNFAAVSMAKGELPLWNPYTLNGMPFQADIQSGIFYIPNLMLTFFVRGGRLNFYWLELEIVLHYMIAGVCMYYLAKHFGLPGIIALFSALVYCLSGFMIVHAIHQVVICQIAWFPLIILFFHKALNESSWEGALRPMIIGGLILGHAVLAGYPQMSLYVYLFLLFFFLFELAVKWRAGGWKGSAMISARAAGFIVIAFAVTAIQLLPTIELAPQSQRAEITYQKSQEGVLSLPQLVTFFVPKYFGESGAQQNTYWGPGVYWAYWETCFYVGIGALLCTFLALFLIRRNRYVAFFFGVILFSLLFALGEKFLIHKFFFYYVPGFSKFRNPGRISLLFSISAALLSGFGLQYLIQSGSAEFKKIRNFLAGVVVCAAALTVAAYQGFLQPVSNTQLYEQVSTLVPSEVKTALLIIVLTAAVLYALGSRKVSLSVGIAVLCIVQFIDLHMFGFNQNNHTQNPEAYYNSPAQLVAMLKQDGENEVTRINARQGNAMLLDRNQGMVDRVFMMEGYTPLALQRYLPPGKNWQSVCDLMNAKYRIHIDEQRRSMEVATAATYIPRAHFVYDEHVLTDEGSLRSFMESDAFDPARTLVLEEPGGLSLRDSLRHDDGKATITSYATGAIAIEASTPRDGYLLLSEIYYPGWNAYVDGAETKIFRADWNLRAFPVKKGSHHIDVRFEPDSFRRGMWITIVTLALCSAGMVYSTKRRSSQSA